MPLDTQEGEVGFQAKPWRVYQPRHTCKVSLFKKYNSCEKAYTCRAGRRVKGPFVFLICGSTQGT